MSTLILIKGLHPKATNKMSMMMSINSLAQKSFALRIQTVTSDMGDDVYSLRNIVMDLVVSSLTTKKIIKYY